jgi:hypothetical protein
MRGRLYAWIAIACSPLVATGESIVGTNGFSFTALAGGSLNEQGGVYFDHQSKDGPLMNIGYCLLGGGNCASMVSSGPVTYWNQDGSADPDFVISAAGGSVMANLRLEVAGYAAINALYWYDPAVGTGTLHPIFAGSDSAGAAMGFSPTSSFGLCLKSGDGNLYCTQSSNNPQGETGHQHFALFQNNGRLIVGIEDLPIRNSGMEGGGDYNDMILTLTFVPEPSTLGMVGIGIAAALFWAHRRRRRLARLN